MASTYGETSGLTSYYLYGKPDGGKALPTHKEAENFARHMEVTYNGSIANHYRSQYKG